MSDDTEDTIAETETLPLDAWHRRKGARMVPFAGYHMPIQYEGIVTEHNWTRNQAGLFDVSHMGQLMVTGDKAAAELEKLLPGAIASLKPGKVRYSLLLDDDGGILDDLMVTNATPWIEGDEEAGTEGRWGEPAYYLVVNGAMKWDDIAHLREHLDDDVTLTHMDEHALIALQGPSAATALNRVMRNVIDDMVFMESVVHDFGEWPLRITRAGYTGEDGFEISLPAEFAESFADRLCAEIEVRPVGLGARDSLRLEAGLPLYGHDITTETDPVSADLGFALTKRRREEGGWMGHAPVMQAFAEGPAQKRVGISIDGRMPAREGALVYSGDTQVGRITSGGFSPTLERPIAMGYVDTALAAEGTELEVEVRKKRLPATVASLPFVPHRYHRGK
ncbi:Aminomethyltransferase (glycine cleavage system T protein) [Qipengyuania citrea LAMA 915]|uniref:aminomethyltransferase n=1 Tax=Qipengyuania citrea LAMA 915 TaxID=1306953 RepID=A0A0L1KCQ6_9SPHN|nr:glycine cleavage system aminomethyltransferase GcvT [Qipengyuania citrea]KNH01659.1 Aminomethyltransferase (glycine cleavage system T protein) [Qipengyuania citrea LAMA 915]HBQ53483.1 glycine cleavage system aminomethyltransferase GcvT [Erythrobacter sp.]HCJ45135.1 glycine cleavage system aminomethyltransferase GcvT [Erythrobacter sp.]